LRIEAYNPDVKALLQRYLRVLLVLIYSLFSAFAFNKWLSSPSGVSQQVPILHEAFWELTGFRFHQNSEVKRVARESNSMMGDPLGSSRVSSQKQNREGVVVSQSGQYRATMVERARKMVPPGPGCDKMTEMTEEKLVRWKLGNT
ncbi:hypothetical protein DVH24_027904, partial [Malus domestica]